jgi:hypothetical protein
MTAIQNSDGRLTLHTPSSTKRPGGFGASPVSINRRRGEMLWQGLHAKRSGQRRQLRLVADFLR